VIAVEVLAAIGLLIPRMMQGAAGVLIVLMLGAVYTHFSRGDDLVLATPAVVLLILLSLIVVLARRERSAISL
jgi:hypothetical protein